jgi:dihydrofolate synthase / folylpolyglutamate synthase
MSYHETIGYLFGLQKHGIKFGLANSVRLMELLGDPHRRFRALHIAGTNGKGSTAALLAGVLRAAGYRTGLYTSPHLVSFAERIRVDGVPIAEERVVELADRVRRRYQDLSPAGAGEAMSPTFFEVTTAMAFTHFAEAGVDVAVVEAGMGGRLDSTNVITPLVSVITNIDLEHTEFLGGTLEQIAAEKAGIIKAAVPVVTGVVQPEAVRVIEQEAARQGAPVYRMPQDFGAGRTSAGPPQRFDYRGIAQDLPDLTVALLGRHQVGNACLAVAAVECAVRAGLGVPESALRSGLASAVWEGRLELLARKPDLYVDGAHNPASAAVLADALQELRSGHSRLVLVLGILQDKDHAGIIAPLAPLADSIIVTRPAYARALDAAALADSVRRTHPDVAVAGTVGEAIARARAQTPPDGLIIVTGSLYTVGDARAAVTGAGAGPLAGLKG